MPLIVSIAILLLIAAVFGPQWWVRHVLAQHGTDRPDLPGTGGELARHLLDEAGLADVSVEQTDAGDHYDPEDRVVRLLPQHFDGRSIAAVAVAAHEVSHAVQHAQGDRAFAARLKLVKNLIWVERIATAILIVAPIMLIVVKTPLVLLAHAGAAIAFMAIRVVIHLTTLPVEFDASFAKALPVIARGGYLAEPDLPAAREVLRAAAWTYVASALATLLNIARWFHVLRF